MAITYMPDVNQMRQQYQNVLADQQKKALQNVQGIFAGRGITGSGEETGAFGDLGYQFGLGAGQAENQLQQYFGGLGMQQEQFNLNKDLQEANLTGTYGGQQTQQSLQQQFANQLAEAGLTGMYGKNPTLANQQFGLNKALQEAGLTGMYNGQQTMTGQEFAQQMGESNQQKDFLARYGLTPELFQSIGSFDPTALKAILQGTAPSGAWGWNPNYQGKPTIKYAWGGDIR